MVKHLKFKSGYRRRDGTPVKAHVQKYTYRDFVKLRLQKIIAKQKGKKDTSSAFKQMGREWKTAKTMNEADIKKNYGFMSRPRGRYVPSGVPFRRSSGSTPLFQTKESEKFRDIARQIEEVKPGSKTVGLFERASQRLEDEKRSTLNLQRAIDARRAAREAVETRRFSRLGVADPKSIAGIRQADLRLLEKQRELLGAERERKLIERFRRKNL